MQGGGTRRYSVQAVDPLLIQQGWQDALDCDQAACSSQKTRSCRTQAVKLPSAISTIGSPLTQSCQRMLSEVAQLQWTSC